MAILVACPTCNRKLRVPDDFAGQRTVCPRCDRSVRVPDPDSPQEDEGLDAISSAGPSESDAVEPMPASTRLGIAALALGVFSLPVLCIPFVGYASCGVSGVGLLLGVWGLLKARHEGAGRPGRASVGGGQVRSGFGARAVDYPLAGMAACLLALVLALWPLLSR